MTLLERQAEDGSWAALLRSGKVLGLLIYLASQVGRRVPRERLADLLWGDEAPERARATLRQTIYTLRGLIGETALDSTRDAIGLLPGHLTVDRDDFLTAARESRFTEMLARYTGPYCDRLEVGGADAYERWLLPERDRLRATIVEEAERAIPMLITSGQAHLAVQAARQLADAEPDEIGVSVLLFDALVAAGHIAEARERLELARVAAVRDGESLPDGVSERLARIKRLATPQPTPAAGTLAVLGQRLVGRDVTLDALLREAERAREGRPRRVVLVGPAGSGKSRVLDEFDARMRLRGARIVRVRLHPSMRDVPYSAFADTVRALTHLPAALGVSEQSARVLVGLLPELASRYPAARGASLPTEHLDIALRDAAADLFASVAEERLVVHLVDDLHYADEASRVVFKAVRLETERRKHETLRLLTVRCLRRISAFDLYLTDTVVEIAPITRDDVRALLTEVAHMPMEPWGEALVERLWESSQGMPQLILQAVRAACAAGALRVASGLWESNDPEALLRNAAEFAGPGPLLDALDPAAERVLTLLAAWGRPLDERDLAGLCARDVPAIPVGAWRPALASLEELGLVQSREATWRIAHDTVLEAVMRNLARHGLQDPFDTLLAYWGDRSRVTVGVVEHLSLLAGQCDEPSRAIRLACRVLRAPTLEQAGISARALAHRVAKGAGHLEWEPVILARLGFFARKGERARALTTGGVPLLFAAVLWLLWMLQPRLVVTTAPMADVVKGKDWFDFAVQPRVAMTDGFGRLVPIAAVVRARTAHGMLVGDTAVALDSGVGQFRRLVFYGGAGETEPDMAELQFVGPWYARGARTRVLGSEFDSSRDAFRMVTLEVNGRQVRDHTLQASMRDTLVLDMTVEYTTATATATYAAGALATWIEPDPAAVRMLTLPSPVKLAWRTVRSVVPPALQPGVGYFVVLLAPEERVTKALAAGLTIAECETLRTTGRLENARVGSGALPGVAVRVEFVQER